MPRQAYLDGCLRQPWEAEGAYAFLASDDASYITGQVIHINGGDIVSA